MLKFITTLRCAGFLVDNKKIKKKLAKLRIFKTENTNWAVSLQSYK